MTVNEIAKASGVSTATVSRVMNNGPVKKETREKVEAVIRELNHLPDDLTKRTLGTPQKALAIVTHSVTNYYTMEFAETVIDRCAEKGILVYLNRSDTYDGQYRSISDLLARGVEGLILQDPPLQSYESDFFHKLAERIPLVLVHSNKELYDINAVMVDQEAGMRRAARYLLEDGHGRQLFIRGDFGFSFEQKERVWREEMTKAGFPPRPEDVLTLEHVDHEKGIDVTYEAVKKVLKKGDIPSAVFTSNDIMGVGALNAIRDCGFRVPEDITLLSHDNTILATSNGLSSVDMKTPSVAHAALDLLDYLIHGADTEPRRILITPDLVIRNTSRKPK